MSEAADLIRRLNNLISTGTITQIDKSKALCKVNILGRETDFIPTMQKANTYKRKWVPFKVGEQVVVLCPFGNADFGVVIGSIFNKNSKEPNISNENIEITEYCDGTKISYDVDKKELKVDASNKITIICKDAKVQANTVKVDSPSIDMGLGGKGVVTGECICALTGLPHHDFSQNTRSKK